MVNITLIAHDRKKELLIRFCDAYNSILRKHNIFSTEDVSKAVANAIGCHVSAFLTRQRGGYQQIASRIICNETDLLIFFKDPLTENAQELRETEIARVCDVHSVPMATNMAAAELMILGMERGDLDWRLVMNSASLARLERTGARDTMSSV